MKRKLIVVLSSLVIIALGAFLAMKLGSREQKRPATVIPDKVKIAKSQVVRYSDYPAMIIGTGRLRSESKIEIFSETQGIIQKTTPEFKVGNRFKKGQVMLKIDEEPAKLNLMSQKSDFLNVLTSIMPDIKADYSGSFEKWKSYLEAFEIEKPIKDLPAISNEKEKYYISNKGIFKLFYTIKNAEVNLDKHTIVAPFDGFVAENMVEIGSLARPGQKLGSFISNNTFELEIGVSESESYLFGLGADVELVSENGEKTWNGKVKRMAANVNAQTQTVQIFVAVNGAELKDGMYLKAKIQGKKLINVLEVPRKSLLNNQFIHKIEDGKLEVIPIDIVKLGESKAYIRGAQLGDTIIIETLVNIPIGAPIQSYFEN